MSQTSVATSDQQIISPLTDDDRHELLTLARRVICDSLAGSADPLTQVVDLPPRLREAGACFVSLRRSPDLLGSVGTLDPVRAIGLDAAEHALSAAFADPRVPAVTADDLADLTVEISVLGPLVPTGATSYAQLGQLLEPGVDGLVVRRNSLRVTFLPAVWEDTRDVNDFLALLWRKAGMTPGDWPSGINTWTYRAETLSDRPPS